MQESREALDDLRKTIGLLRHPGEPVAPTEHTPGLIGVADLLASFRNSGMPIDHRVDGETRPLPPAANLTAYRVVQESLTHVRKDAGDAATQVRLSFEATALHIVVENEGNGRSTSAQGIRRGPVADHAGHGIVGMRERVSALGGRLEVGPRPAGGFRVSAVLPLSGG